MNKEEFVKEQMKLSKEDIVANYWYTYQDNVEKLGIEHQLKLKDKEIEKLKRHIEDKEEVEMIYRDNDIRYLEQENKQLKEDFAVLKKLQMISNDILTELEEWLKKETIELYDKDNPMLLDQSYITYATERKMAYMYILDKIQELKEKYKIEDKE